MTTERPTSPAAGGAPPTIAELDASEPASATIDTAVRAAARNIRAAITLRMALLIRTGESG